MPKLHSGRVVLTLEDSGLLILVGLLELLDFFGGLNSSVVETFSMLFEDRGLRVLEQDSSNAKIALG